MFDADLRLTWKDHLKVLSVSDRVASRLGYTPSGTRNESLAIQALIHPGDLAAIRDLLSTTALHRRGEVHLRMRGADGRIRCLCFRYLRETMSHDGMKLTLHLGEPARSVSRETETCGTEMLAMLDHLDQCACIKDRDHIIRQANRSFRALFSEDRGVVGLTDYDLFPEDYADRSYDADQQVFSGTPMARFELNTTDTAGKRRAFESRSLPVRHGRGPVQWVCSVVSETTARALAEHALRMSEQSLMEVREIARIGSFAVDIPAQTWTASDVLYEILGLDKGCPRTIAIWSDLTPKDDHARLSNLYGEVIQSNATRLDCETRFFRGADKTPRWARLRAQLERDSRGDPSVLRGTIEDITERKSAEASVRKSSALLEMFIQDAPTGLAMFDRELRYMSASRRWIEDRNLDAWNLSDRSCYDVHPNLPTQWMEDHRRALDGETSPFREDRYEDESGRIHWVRRMVLPWRDQDVIGGIVVLSEDITGRMQAEIALRESEESLNEAQAIAGVGSYVFDIAHDRWTSSEFLDEIFDIGPSYERTREGWTNLVHPDDRNMMALYVVNEVVGRGAPFNKEYRIVRFGDKAERWVHGLGRVEPDEQGRPRILRGTIQDITWRKESEALLRESRHQLQLFVEHAPAAIAMFDRDMKYLAVSRRWIRNFNLTDRAILGHCHYELFPELPERWKQAHRRGLAGEGVRMEEEQFELADGKERWTRWELLPWYKDDGAVGGIVLFAEDITALKQNAERLQLAASVFTHTSESIVITDADGTILDVNAAFTRITGYSREEVLGQNPRLLNSGRQPREFYANLWAQLRDNGQWFGEIWNRGKSGQILPGMLTISAVPDDAGKPKQYVGLFSDLSPVKEREQQLKHVAHFDVLTGLPNRALLTDRLRQAMAQARLMGRLLVIAYVDFDDFAELNNRHGRLIGDQVMNAVIQCMSSVLREADTLARLGGDEFAAVLLDLANMDQGLSLVGLLRDAITEPVRIGDLSLRVSASIGVSFFPQADQIEPDQLIRQADQAMYFAKLAGKSRFHVFDPMLDRAMRGRHEDLPRMRQALRAEEFELYFQPKVNMRTGAVLGMEALIRWRHPELGLLLPEHFLPVMEGNILVVELGEWVISSALDQLETWLAQGLDIPVSVNIDAMQLQDPRFVERVTELLERHPHIEPSKLEFEVLESSAFQDVSQVSEVIRACSKLGVSFAIDDFGTGYSSLSYLKRLPVDVLKIDRSFVHDMLDDPEDLAILEGILVLAKAFRRKAIAEGVETVDHGLMLLQLGCQIGQGFQIARPMRAADVPPWAAVWKPDPRWAKVTEIAQSEWSVLHAGVEHRAWALEFEDFLHGRRHTAPAMDAHHCQLGTWLDGERSAGRADRVDIRAVDDAHERLHTTATKILDAKRRNGDLPVSGLTELHALKENLIGTLQHYLHRQ